MNQRSMIYRLLVYLIVGMLWSGTGYAQTDATPASDAAAQQATKLSMEAKVLSKIHHSNQMEMQAGELAMQKGNALLVRRYGERLLRDHRMGDRKVTELAASEGIDLVQPQPQTAQEQQQMQEQQHMMQKLQQAEGAEFDAVFLQAMQKAHTQAVQQLTEAHAKLTDPEVRELVGKLIPILEQHRTLATHLHTSHEST